MNTEFSSGLGWSCKKAAAGAWGLAEFKEKETGRSSSYSTPTTTTRGSPGILKAQTLQGMWSHPTWQAK